MFFKKCTFLSLSLNFLSSSPFSPLHLGISDSFPSFILVFFTLLAITLYLSPLYPYLFHLLIPSLLSIVSLSSDSIPYCFGFLFPFLSFIVHVFPLYPPFVFLPFILCLHPPIHNFIFLKLSTFLFPPLTALLLSYVSFVQVRAASNMSITCQFYCFFPP